MKFRSKISYLGKKKHPWQMAEQFAVEVDVKNVTEHIRKTDGQTHLFGKDMSIDLQTK